MRNVNPTPFPTLMDQIIQFSFTNHNTLWQNSHHFTPLCYTKWNEKPYQFQWQWHGNDGDYPYFHKLFLCNVPALVHTKDWLPYLRSHLTRKGNKCATTMSRKCFFYGKISLITIFFPFRYIFHSDCNTHFPSSSYQGPVQIQPVVYIVM